MAVLALATADADRGYAAAPAAERRAWLLRRLTLAAILAGEAYRSSQFLLG